MFESKQGTQEGGLIQQELRHVQKRENREVDLTAWETDVSVRLKHIRNMARNSVYCYFVQFFYNHQKWDVN